MAAGATGSAPAGPRRCALPRTWSAGIDASENGPSASVKRLSPGAARAEVGDHRRHLVGQPAEVVQRRAQLAQEGREALDRRAGCRRAPRRWPGWSCWPGLMKSASCSRSRASGPSAWSEFSREVGQRAVLAGQDRPAPCRSRAAPGWRGGSRRSGPGRGRRGRCRTR